MSPEERLAEALETIAASGNAGMLCERLDAIIRGKPVHMSPLLTRVDHRAIDDATAISYAIEYTARRQGIPE